MNQVSNHELARWLDTTLQVQSFKDYCPNGLQVEGKTTIKHIITGVTATQALLEAAITANADAILVHHGWFWKNESPCIRGPKRQRLALAIGHDINVYAYHLPLDAHTTLGNNAQLGQVLGLKPMLDDQGKPWVCGPDGLVWVGECPPETTLAALGDTVCNVLHRQPLIVGNRQQLIKRVAWCTGGAQSMMEAAVAVGADAYLTGEASEPNFHLAQETGVGFIAAGHHATERYGVKALGEAVAAHFGIRVEFMDLDNPI
ncbi:MAG TPA: Nif3-like dinuclear metal center hexameric protein [Candidimonas sp.]|nr:Nif3-like dinuclear metal center hexameric protein [Candidimonas sp.]